MSSIRLKTSTLAFLNDLAENNNKEWFQANKEQYNRAKDDFEEFVLKIISLFNEKLELSDVNPKECIYRIFKDVRFSKDGTLYKTEFGATIAKNGKKTNKAALHLYIKHDGEVFIDTGTCHVEPKDLANIRAAIDYDSSGLDHFLNSEDYKSLFDGELIGSRVKSAPRGYSQDHKSIELLRYKNFSIRAKFNTGDITSEGFEQKITKVVEAAEPFRDYLNQAISFSEK